MEYIDKSALVAEIERLRERFIAFHHRDGHDWPLDNYGKMRAYNEVLSFLDTLEVKEVDLEKAALDYANKQLIEAGVTDENCPRELAVAQASLMVSGFKAGAQWQKEHS